MNFLDKGDIGISSPRRSIVKVNYEWVLTVESDLAVTRSVAGEFDTVQVAPSINARIHPVSVYKIYSLIANHYVSP
jgi:hypothetical protein